MGCDLGVALDISFNYKEDKERTAATLSPFNEYYKYFAVHKQRKSTFVALGVGGGDVGVFLLMALSISK